MVRYRNGVSIEELKLLPIQPRDVLIRTQASIACYSLTPFALNTNNYPQPVILNHSGMGVVEEVGAQVKRVQPGDRVIVAGTPECGQCYQCLQGRPDWCAFLAEVDLHPIAEMADGDQGAADVGTRRRQRADGGGGRILLSSVHGSAGGRSWRCWRTREERGWLRSITWWRWSRGGTWW